MRVARFRLFGHGIALCRACHPVDKPMRVREATEYPPWTRMSRLPWAVRCGKRLFVSTLAEMSDA